MSVLHVLEYSSSCRNLESIDPTKYYSSALVLLTPSSSFLNLNPNTIIPLELESLSLLRFTTLPFVIFSSTTRERKGLKSLMGWLMGMLGHQLETLTNGFKEVSKDEETRLEYLKMRAWCSNDNVNDDHITNSRGMLTLWGWILLMLFYCC